MNLYTFSKHAWHVKLFTWMWGVNPSYKFKTMCPYFWQFIGSLLIFPLIVIGKVINLALKKLQLFLDRKFEQNAVLYIKHLKDRLNNGPSNKEIYDIYKSRCWNKYKDEFTIDDWIIREDIQDAAYEYKKELDIKQKENQKKFDELKYGTVGTYFSYLIGLLLISSIIYLLYLFVYLFTFDDFIAFIILFFKIVLISSMAFAILYGIILFFLEYFDKFSCKIGLNKLKLGTRIINVFKLMFKIIYIIYDMILNIYKKSCPIITWK